MNNRNKHIKQTDHGMIRSFIKIAIVLFCSLLFIQPNMLKAQVINNNGAGITVTNGVVMNSGSLNNSVNGLLTNDGTIDLSGTFINTWITIGKGTYNIAGDWTNTNIFNEETSTVHFNGTNLQTITSPGGETFFNLTINNSGASATNRINLFNNVNVSGTLSISQGNVETGLNTLYLTNQTPASLNYTSTSGSRVIGLFERGINGTGNYLFPLGSDSNYNPLNLTINTTPTAGSVLSEFIVADLGSSGLPLPDPPVEVYQAFNDGYWSLTANTFSCNDFNINMDGAGFSPAVQNITRIIKRPVAGDWLLDGIHNNAAGTVTYRNNLTGGISATGNYFGLGMARPLVLDHPADTAVCDGTNAFFKVVATGLDPLSYQWQENRGAGWNNIIDASIYLGIQTNSLQISVATLLMDGYRYRVIITDANDNPKISDAALLTVNPLPVATATPERDTICNNETTYIVLTSDVPNTTFTLEVVYSGSIAGASTLLNAGTTIQQTLTNPLNSVDSVIYRIIPMGPYPTDCIGTADTAVILVNPTPLLIPLIDAERICWDGNTGITLTTPTTLTNGIVTFDYTAVSTGVPGDLTGYTVSDAGLTNFDQLVQTLTNSSDTVQSVIYSITPKTLSTGCADGPTVDVEIKVNAEPIQDLIITNNLSCYGQREGSLDLVLAEGSGPFEIYWTGTEGYTNEGEEDIDSLISGIYWVEVYDSLGCQSNDHVTISSPGQLKGNLVGLPKSPRNKWNISCPGGSDGVVGFEVLENNYPPFNYWLFGPDGDTIDAGNANNYDIFYFDSLPEGVYEMILRDDEGCYESWTDTLFTPDPIEAQMHSPIYIDPYNLSCRGYSDGSIVIDTVANGNGIYQDPLYNYNYLWSDENGLLPGDPTLKDQSGLDSGVYYVQITDILGCTLIDSIRLIDPPGIDLTDTVFSISDDGNYNISCYGASDGSIDITIVGGSGNYSYLWTGPTGAEIDPVAEDQTGLIAGIYDVTVLDINDCQKDYSFTLTQPDSLSLTYSVSMSITGNNNINCAGGNEGSIDINIGGGSVDNYTYEWLTDDGSGINGGNQDQTGLTAGHYNVIVTDLNGCVLSREFILTEPDSLLTNIAGTDITCSSASYDDGAADLTVTGGTGQGTYIFNWSNGAVTEDIANLTVGTYWVTVLDANNCTRQDSVDILLPPPLLINIDTSDYNGYNISCTGGTNGWINIVMDSGAPPYLFSWTGPGTFTSSEQNIQNLDAGVYNLHIVDDNSCFGDTTILLTEPDSLIVDILLSTTASEDYQIYCYGDSTGMIDLDVTGGIEPYSYLWMDGTAESSRSLLQAGDYTVIIIDKNSCVLDTTVTLAQPPPLTDSVIITNAYCPDMPDGEIELIVEGGYTSSTYYYLWSDNVPSSYINDSYIEELTAGIYTVIITDDNNCELRDTLEVKFENSQCLEIPNAFSPNGDGINDYWQIYLIELYPNAVIEIFNRWGKVVYKSKNGYDPPWDGSYRRFKSQMRKSRY